MNPADVQEAHKTSKRIEWDGRRGICAVVVPPADLNAEKGRQNPTDIAVLRAKNGVSRSLSKERADPTRPTEMACGVGQQTWSAGPASKGSGGGAWIGPRLGGQLKTGNLWTAQNRQFPGTAETCAPQILSRPP
jgi:hypothetical protein